MQKKCKIVFKVFLTFKYSCEVLLYYKIGAHEKSYCHSFQIWSESQFNKFLVVKV